MTYEDLWEAAFTDLDDCIVSTLPSGKRRTVHLLGKCVTASRAVWILRYGVPDNGLHVLHSCNGGSGETGCVNVNHLYLGTQKDNTFDMALSSGHSRAKLSADDVREIRRIGILGGPNGVGGNVRELADRYNIGLRSIRAILKRESWQHV